MTDELLVAAMRAGDEDACEQFDRRFRPRIEAFVRRRSVPGQDCADVVQDVLADAIRQIQQGKFRHQAALGTWLHPIINGWVVNYFRKHGRLQTISLEEIAITDEVLVATSNVDAVVAINQALSRLSTTDRFVLLLHERDKFTLEEIGRIVGLRKSAVGERLARAREQFRAAILKGGGKFSHSKRPTEQAWFD